MERDYSDKDLRAALGSSPPLEKMKMTDTRKWSALGTQVYRDGISYASTFGAGTSGGDVCLAMDIAKALNSAALITDLVDALQVCLGHLTGGLDGDWRDCDPAELAREVLAREVLARAVNSHASNLALITELVGALEGIKRLAKDRNFTSVNFQLNTIEIATDEALAKAKVQS